MNGLETWFCSSSIWRRITEKQILPWLLSDASLGGQVLEVGAGAGSATRELLRRSGRVTCLEYDHTLAVKLAGRFFAGARSGQRLAGDRFVPGASAVPGIAVVQGDAAMLPFATSTFSAVVAVLMLHHLPSPEAQDRAFAEIARVLQPDGHLFAFEIPTGWLQRLSHWRSTFVPVPPDTLADRLARVGLSEPRIDVQARGFRVCAVRSPC